MPPVLVSCAGPLFCPATFLLCPHVREREKAFCVSLYKDHNSPIMGAPLSCVNLPLIYTPKGPSLDAHGRLKSQHTNLE